jgi:uncharacterized protein YjbI with pentapeptide repeats
MSCDYRYRQGESCTRKPRYPVAAPTHCELHFPGDESAADRAVQITNYLQSLGSTVDLGGCVFPAGQSYFSRLFRAHSVELNVTDATFLGDFALPQGQMQKLIGDGLRVHGATSLQKVVITQAAELNNAHFSGSFSALECQFNTPLMIADCKFHGEADISSNLQAGLAAPRSDFHKRLKLTNGGAHPCKVDLSEVRTAAYVAIGGRLSTVELQRAFFNARPHIAGSAEATLSLKGCRLRRGLSLSGKFVTVDMDSETVLRALVFKDGTDVAGALTLNGRFSQLALPRCNLQGGLTLRGECRTRVQLGGAAVHGVLDAEGFVFARGLDMYNARLARSELRFARAIIRESAALSADRNTDELGPTSFKGASLAGASFDNRKFGAPADFSQCTFRTAPSFVNSELHPDTQFPTSLDYFPDTESKNAGKLYQVLRKHSEDLRAHLDEGLFNALEQRSIVKTGDLAWPEKRFSQLYDLVSLYGTSFIRPLIAWLAMIGVFVLLFASPAISTLCLPCRPDPSVWSTAFFRSFSAALLPFFDLRQQQPLWWLGMLESLLSVPLVAVFVIAIRWRFKRG